MCMLEDEDVVEYFNDILTSNSCTKEELKKALTSPRLFSSFLRKMIRAYDKDLIYILIDFGSLHDTSSDMLSNLMTLSHVCTNSARVIIAVKAMK